ncbi:uncharacterized protein LOC135942980 [Cloeon dipterum]|uniref:uncharacterized protein LOC135942980 n=1 Tax=Cloeon dipterum TaxID=197152 RepID=UPI00321F95AA
MGLENDFFINRRCEIKFLLLILILITASSRSNCASVEFEDKSVDNWQLLIGANSKELQYDFCKYNATSQGTQCTSFAQVASININDVCNCSVQHKFETSGTFTFSVNCTSNSSWCPKNLFLHYHQQGSKMPYDVGHLQTQGAAASRYPRSTVASMQLAILYFSTLAFSTP